MGETGVGPSFSMGPPTSKKEPLRLSMSIFNKKSHQIRSVDCDMSQTLGSFKNSHTGNL